MRILNRRPRRPGLSLIESVLAVIVIGIASILYSTGWNLAVSQQSVAGEFDAASILMLRQYELLRKSIRQNGAPQNPRPDLPFNEPDFFNGGIDTGGGPGTRFCPPYRYFNDGALDLDGPATISHEVTLDDTNSFRFPTNAAVTWLLPVGGFTSDIAQAQYANLLNEGYGVIVHASRVTEPVGVPPVDYTDPLIIRDTARETSLIKYTIRIVRTDDGRTANGIGAATVPVPLPGNFRTICQVDHFMDACP